MHPTFLAAAALALLATTLPADTTVRYRTIEVDGINLFYREAGPRDAPPVLLLHGFPSSSHMFRNLIPALATQYRVLAPDLPGFGQTEVPPARNYVYRFESLAETLVQFTNALGLERYAIYVFDYGAPTGFRLALQQPDRVIAIVSQNGNAYEEGLSAAWDPIRAYWKDPSPSNRDALRPFLRLETTRWQYTHGVSDPSRIAPEAYLMDQWGLDRPGQAEIQLDLFGDYQSNVTLYPEFQRFFRERRPAILAIWGRNDPFFLPAGAEAFRRDQPSARVRLLETGHFALETHASEIAMEMLRFLKEVRF